MQAPFASSMSLTKNLSTVLVVVGILIACYYPSAFSQLPEYAIQRDVVYGGGQVKASAQPATRNLLLDAYFPVAGGETSRLNPAVILAFGGAFHRGDKGDFHFNEDGASDSSMADYCMALVQRGFACFSIEYRLTPEDPVFPDHFDQSILMPKALLESPIVTGRVEFVRKKMGLPPLNGRSRERLWNATFAAVEDMEVALNFVRSNASVYNVDPARIAIGGFSAGAMTAINLAYGAQADVQAVVALSGTNWGHALDKTVRETAPPLLLFAGQWDLPGIRRGSAYIVNLLQSRGVAVSQAWVPGFGHFYPMQAPSLSAQFEKVSIIDRLTHFLNENLRVRSG